MIDNQDRKKAWIPKGIVTDEKTSDSEQGDGINRPYGRIPEQYDSVSAAHFVLFWPLHYSLFIILSYAIYSILYFYQDDFYNQPDKYREFGGYDYMRLFNYYRGLYVSGLNKHVVHYRFLRDFSR